MKLFIDVDITGEQWEPEKKREFVNSIFVKFCNVVDALYNIEYKFQNMRILDSSGVIEKKSEKVFKTSFHVIFDEVHFANIEKLRMFINHYFPELLQFTGVDKAVYNNGQLFRLPLCTKKGRNLPLEFMDDREDDFQSAMLCSISSTSVLLAVDKRIFKKQLHSVIPINYEDVSELEKLFLENISRFQKYCDEYGDWIKIGLKMCSSGFHVQTLNMTQKLENFMCFLKHGKLIMILHVFHHS